MPAAGFVPFPEPNLPGVHASRRWIALIFIAYEAIYPPHRPRRGVQDDNNNGKLDIELSLFDNETL
jgi:hypothetical protein